MPDISDRDRLAATLKSLGDATSLSLHSSRWWGQMADALIAEGVRMPALRITTPADADRLPAGAVVINDDGQVAQRYDGMGGWWQVLDNGQFDSRDLLGDGWIDVLWIPAEGATDGE